MAFYDHVPFTPESSVGYITRRFYQTQVAALEPIFAAEGLTLTHWSSLVYVYVHGATTGAEIARDLFYDKGAMTRLLEQLDQRGLIVRQRDEGDRRCVNVSLTDEGRALAERCRDKVTEKWNGWLEGWADDDVHQLLAWLNKLRVRIEADLAEAGE